LPSTDTQRAVASVPTVVPHPGCGADKPTGTGAPVFRLLTAPGDVTKYPDPFLRPAADGAEAPAGIEMSMAILAMPALLPAAFSSVYRYTNTSPASLSTDTCRRAADKDGG
jgi:hypothetical protein